jgi:multicomponent Na+:H+ antiporter subunit E
MIPLLANIFLALIWAILSGAFTLPNLLIGFVLGYIILYFQQQIIGPSNYFGKARKLIAFLLFFFWEIIVSSVRVAWEVIQPRDRTRPGIIALDLGPCTEFEAYMLATVITLTPGSLSMEVQVKPDRKILYIHAMFADDPEQMKEDLRNGLCRRLLEVLR